MSGIDSARRGPVRSASLRCSFTSLPRFQPLASRRRSTNGCSRRIDWTVMPCDASWPMLYLTSTCFNVSTCSPFMSMEMSPSSTPVNRFPPSLPIEMVPFRYWPACRTANFRSQSLNHGVCDTISASARMPTSSVPTSATTRRVRLMYLFAALVRRWSMALKRLADGEMEAEPPRLLLAVHEQPFDRIQLVPEVDADRADRGHVAQAGADVVPQIVQVEVPRVVPDVARVGECHGAQVAPDGNAQFRGALEHRVAANRQPGDERRDFEPSPPAQARGAAQPIAPIERHLEVRI